MGDVTYLLRELRQRALEMTGAPITATTIVACLDLGAIRCPTNEETLALVAKELADTAARMERLLTQREYLKPPPTIAVTCSHPDACPFNNVARPTPR